MNPETCDIHDLPCVINGYLPDDSGVYRVVEIDGTYLLWWSDGVANDWEERYPTMALAMLRLAVLCQCAIESDRQFFAHQFAEFSVIGQDFLHQEVT